MRDRCEVETFERVISLLCSVVLQSFKKYYLFFALLSVPGCERSH